MSNRASSEEIAEARRLHKQGLTTYAISVRLKRNHLTVRCWLEPDFHERHRLAAAKANAKRRMEAAE